MTENELSRVVFDCALKVHQTLGPGLLESAYEECLFYELKKSGLAVQKQKPLPLIYEEVKLDVGYRIDIVVEDKLISYGYVKTIVPNDKISAICKTQKI